MTTYATYGSKNVHLGGKQVPVNELDVTKDESWKKDIGKVKSPKILFVPASNAKNKVDEWTLSYRSGQLAAYLKGYYTYTVEVVSHQALSSLKLPTNSVIILCIQGHGSEDGTIDGYDANQWYKDLTKVLESQKETLRLLYVFGCHGAALALGHNRITNKATKQGGLQHKLADNNFNVSVRGMWQNMTVTAQGKPVGKSDHLKKKMDEYELKKTKFDSWIDTTDYGPVKKAALAPNDRGVERFYLQAQTERQEFFLNDYPFVPLKELGNLFNEK